MEGLATGAAQEVLKTGLLGALLVIQGVVIWALYRRGLEMQEKFVDLAVKTNTALVEAANAMKAQAAASAENAEATRDQNEVIKLWTDRMDRRA